MKAEELHKQSENLREQDKHVEALEFIEQAIVAYQNEKNYKGLAKALQSRVLIYRHLFLLTDDDVFGLLARKDAEASLEIAQKNNLRDVIASCYFRIGEVAGNLGNNKKAIENYQKALDNYTGTKAELGDYRYHLGTVQYFDGIKEEGKKNMLQGLKEIQENRSEIDPFLANVWESGCYMRLAEVLKDDELKEAKEYLRQAKKIIDFDKKLIIRRRQWKKLAEKFV